MESLPSSRGFNVIGYVSGNLGLGVAARSLISLTLARGFAVAIFDMDPEKGRRGFDMTYRNLTVETMAELPYSISIFVLPPASLAALLKTSNNEVFRSNRLNVALSFWELPTLPRRWVPVMNAFDVVAAASETMRATFQFALSGPLVTGARLAISVPAGVVSDRQRFKLPPDAFIFVASFEPFSDPVRKNPLAVIDSYLRGVGDDPRAWLVLKANNVRDGANLHPFMEKIRLRCANHPRIRVIDEVMSYADVLSLYASCDVYVSLHRAEGLGLALMEAMALGKPVIATAWSGNMTFMDHTNACLVRYQLVPVESELFEYGEAFIGRGVSWADPSIEDAAAWMRQLLASPELGQRIGANAARDVARLNAGTSAEKLLEELLAIDANRSFLPRRSAEHAQIAYLQDMLDIQEEKTMRLASELKWVTEQPAYKFLRASRNLLRSAVKGIKRGSR